jgi:hypothetical protein
LDRPVKIEVTIGETNVGASTANAARTRHSVEAKMWKQHESYSSDFYNDNIALIYLPTNVVRSTNVGVAYLYLNDPEDSNVFAASFLNQVGNIAGFGQTAQTGAVSPTLKTATAKIFSLTDCQTQHSHANSKNICTKSVDTTIIKNMCLGK